MLRSLTLRLVQSSYLGSKTTTTSPTIISFLRLKLIIQLLIYRKNCLKSRRSTRGKAGKWLIKGPKTLLEVQIMPACRTNNLVMSSLKFILGTWMEPMKGRPKHISLQHLRLYVSTNLKISRMIKKIFLDLMKKITEASLNKMNFKNSEMLSVTLEIILIGYKMFPTA